MNAHHCHEHCCKNSSDAKWREKPERRIRRTPPPSSLRLAAAANATPGRKPTSGRRGALQIWLENEVIVTCRKSLQQKPKPCWRHRGNAKLSTSSQDVVVCNWIHR